MRYRRWYAHGSGEFLALESSSVRSTIFDHGYMYFTSGAKGRDLSQRDFSAAVLIVLLSTCISMHISERLLVREIQHRATTLCGA